MFVNGMGHDLFAGTAFTHNQNRGSITTSNASDHLKDLAHTFTMTDEVRKMIVIAPFTAQLTQFTVGWTGAEIEQCVISAITRARLADRELTEQDLISIAAKLVPLSRTMKEQINHIRGWAFERAVRASPHAIGR